MTKKNAAAQAQRQRVNAVIRDRKADSIVQGMAEESLMVPNPISRWERIVLNFDVDWMDQANSGVPTTLCTNNLLTCGDPSWEPVE